MVLTELAEYLNKNAVRVEGSHRRVHLKLEGVKLGTDIFRMKKRKEQCSSFYLYSLITVGLKAIPRAAPGRPWGKSGASHYLLNYRIYFPALEPPNNLLPFLATLFPFSLTL